MQMNNKTVDDADVMDMLLPWDNYTSSNNKAPPRRRKKGGLKKNTGGGLANSRRQSDPSFDHIFSEEGNAMTSGKNNTIRRHSDPYVPTDDELFDIDQDFRRSFAPSNKTHNNNLHRNNSEPTMNMLAQIFDESVQDVDDEYMLEFDKDDDDGLDKYNNKGKGGANHNTGSGRVATRGDGDWSSPTEDNTGMRSDRRVLGKRRSNSAPLTGDEWHNLCSSDMTPLDHTNNAPDDLPEAVKILAERGRARRRSSSSSADILENLKRGRSTSSSSPLQPEDLEPIQVNTKQGDGAMKRSWSRSSEPSGSSKDNRERRSNSADILTFREEQIADETMIDTAHKRRKSDPNLYGDMVGGMFDERFGSIADQQSGWGNQGNDTWGAMNNRAGTFAGAQEFEQQNRGNSSELIHMLFGEGGGDSRSNVHQAVPVTHQPVPQAVPVTHQPVPQNLMHHHQQLQQQQQQQQPFPPPQLGFTNDLNITANQMIFNNGYDDPSPQPEPHVSINGINGSQDVTLVLSAVEEAQNNLWTLQPIVMQLGDQLALDEITNALKMATASLQCIVSSDLPSAYAKLNEVWSSIKKIENRLVVNGPMQQQQIAETSVGQLLMGTGPILPTVPPTVPNPHPPQDGNPPALKSNNIIHKSKVHSNNTTPTSVPKPVLTVSPKVSSKVSALRKNTMPKKSVPPKKKPVPAKKEPAPKLEDLPEQDKNNPDIIMNRLQALMLRTKESQERLEDWDKRNGLPKSHCMTMVNSSRSRTQLQTGEILKKWTGAPLIESTKGGDGSGQDYIASQQRENQVGVEAV